MTYVAPSFSGSFAEVSEDQLVWYVVALWIILGLAFTIVAGIVAYCVIRGRYFTGSWTYTNGGGSVRIGCS